MTGASGLGRLLRVLAAVAGVVGVHDVLRGVDRIVTDDGRVALASPRVRRDAASIDSELRFGSAWYATSAVLMWRAGGAPATEGAAIRLVSAGWLLAAIGRLRSMRARGRPHGLYVALTVAELLIPAVLVPWQRAVSPEAAASGRGRPRRRR